VTPAKRGKKIKVKVLDEPQDPMPSMAITWAQRLKRVFDIETCGKCGGPVKAIACIEDPVVIEKIINHLKERETVSGKPIRLPESRVRHG